MQQIMRVLIIEDSEDDAVFISRELRQSKFEIVSRRVETKEQLEEALAANSWDVILSDNSLPTFCASQALEVVQRLAPDVPFIIVSGSIGEDAAVTAMRAGAHDYIMKDSLARLMPAIEREIRDATMRSERRQSAIALKESEARLRAIVETAVDAIVTIDESGIIESVNPAAGRIFGYSTGEMIGQSVNILMPQPYVHEHDAYIRNYVKTGRRKIIGIGREVVGIRKDGTKFAMDLSVNEVRLGDRRLFTGIIRDISDRRKLEEQLLQSQRMDSIGRLAGGVAHDFNNLLTIIFGYAEMLEAAIPAGTTEHASVANIQIAASRAASLTHQLLAFARRQIIEPKIISLNELVLNVEKLLHRLIGEDIELLVKPDPNLGAVRADPSQFEQIVVNLTVNARDAMPGGGKITLETANLIADEEYARQHVGVSPGEYVMMSVSDTGSGMPPDVVTQIFEPFYTTKSVGKGTGLGLATCYGIVKQAGGHIWVYSEEGMGATFKVFMPRVYEEQDSSDAEKEPKSQGGSETILLVEDEQMVRDIAASILESNGYFVLQSLDGEEARQIAADHVGQIHLLVTDVVMPHMNGSQLADMIRTARPETKTLFLSGYTDETIIHHGILEPGVAFMQKPFTTDMLLRKVRDVLDEA